MASQTPTGLIAKEGIELLTWSTPNGYKASIVLEELKEAYGLDYTFQPIDIHKNVQKEPWFTAINPNGRIPAIVDHDNGDLAVFEGNAILSYLTRRYDTENRISFAITDDDYTRAESWVGWQHGGIGPMQGQAGHFLYAAKDGAPWGIYRYIGETQRLWGILDKALADRDYLVGPARGRFSIADISLIGWVQAVPMIGIDIYKYPAIKAWLDRCLARPAVQRGITVPAPPSMSVDFIERRIAEGDKELKEKVEGLKKRVAEAFEKYEGK
ncbi:glutathione S-transferase II [Plectosphaerella plurivora]|uniref:Glutathione S-transferase II n=1 Tax=Plectosphaerella plurivora TaxID=936078 RepID=A0A9P9A966_9PEZI|nr:glutathione S-transferase II [Plectosphaerella plurivora]